MSKTGSIVLRVTGIVLVLALVAGVGVAAYGLGYRQAVVNSPEIAAALKTGEVPSQLAPFHTGAIPLHPYGMRPYRAIHPISSILGVFFFGMLLLMGLRLIFRPYFMGPGHWHAYRHPWGYPPPAGQAGVGGEGEVPPSQAGK